MDGLDFIETILVYKLPQLRQPRFYQEASAEGLEEGKQEGKQE